jgi:hypothetical protein
MALAPLVRLILDDLSNAEVVPHSGFIEAMLGQLPLYPPDWGGDPQIAFRNVLLNRGDRYPGVWHGSPDHVRKGENDRASLWVADVAPRPRAFNKGNLSSISYTTNSKLRMTLGRK